MHCESLFDYYREVVRSFVDDDCKNLVSIDPPKDKIFGDFSTNIAMVISKKLSRNSLDIAQEICEKMSLRDDVADVVVKNPGFINWKIPSELLYQYIPGMLSADYGKRNIGHNSKVNVEYVSANPTGPLHAGHARGAVSGDVLANLLSFVGFDVTKEYYVNDAGNQIDIIAKSLHHRYLELYDMADGYLPNWAYPGEYVVDVAKKISETYGDKFLKSEEDEWKPIFKTIALEAMMGLIKEDLAILGVKHDVFLSELSLIQNGDVEKAVAFLESKNLIYTGILNKPKGKEIEDWEEREQLLFRSTNFGDEVDRPLKKSDGSWTYFASDIAYHLNKINRGFDDMIDFWGADHGGYIKRMKAAVSALSDNKSKLDVKITQLVRFMQDGKELKMSKRAGTFVTAREVLDHVGKDVVRFIMLTRKDDAPLDFDLQKVVDQSRENPVFYVQYAHARINSVLKLFADTFKDAISGSTVKITDLLLAGSEDEISPNLIEDLLRDIDLSLLSDPECLSMLKVIADWPRQVEMAARSKEPHRIVFFVCEVAACFHSLWTQGKESTHLRFVLPNDFKVSCARMIMLKAVQNVIRSAFKIVGVTPIEELR